MKELAQFPCLCRTDGALPVERFVDVAALAEDCQQQLGGGFAGMLDYELQACGRRGVIRRHAMLAVVVLDEDGEQVHEAVFGSCPAALHEKFAETRAETIVILIVLDAAGEGFREELFVSCGHSTNPLDCTPRESKLCR